LFDSAWTTPSCPCPAQRDVCDRSTLSVSTFHFGPLVLISFLPLFVRSPPRAPPPRFAEFFCQCFPSGTLAVRYPGLNDPTLCVSRFLKCLPSFIHTPLRASLCFNQVATLLLPSAFIFFPTPRLYGPLARVPLGAHGSCCG